MMLLAADFLLFLSLRVNWKTWCKFQAFKTEPREDRVSTASYACVPISLKYLTSLKDPKSLNITLGLLSLKIIIFDVAVTDELQCGCICYKQLQSGHLNISNLEFIDCQ